MITKSGIYDRIPMAEYHGQLTPGPSISSSGLRTIFTKSPAHYYVDSYLNPDRVIEPDSAALIIGRAAHHLLLGEEAFSTQFIARPDKLDGEPWQGNRTACKAWLKEQAKAGRTVLLPAQIAQIRGMARSLAKHPLIDAGILNGDIEQSIVWKDKETGVWLKVRPDAIPNDSGDFADLKTTVETGFKLDRAVISYRYDMQAALVKWAAREVLNMDMASFSFVFVEKDPPHCVDVLVLSPEDIARAELDLRAALRTFSYCLKTGDWFGPSGSQRDARFVHVGEYAQTSNTLRREFLEREIAPGKTEEKYSAADYLGAG